MRSENWQGTHLLLSLIWGHSGEPKCGAYECIGLAGYLPKSCAATSIGAIPKPKNGRPRNATKRCATRSSQNKIGIPNAAKKHPMSCSKAQLFLHPQRTRVSGRKLWPAKECRRGVQYEGKTSTMMVGLMWCSSGYSKCFGTSVYCWEHFRDLELHFLNSPSYAKRCPISVALYTLSSVWNKVSV